MKGSRKLENLRKKGAQLSPAQIKIGTCGYSYPGPPPKGWFGIFYPETKGKKFSELEYYSQSFDTVEINSTFYRIPSPEMAGAWVRKTPDDFEFCVKVFQSFTHAKKIGKEIQREEKWDCPTQEDVDLFRKGVEPLAESGKLGILLFQYPPSFYLTRQNVDRLRWTLEAFKDYPKVVELRHKSWSDRLGEVKALLNELGASWAVIDEPKFASSVKQEFKPVGDIFYFRLHGRNAANWWEHKESWMRYDYCYSKEEIRQVADKIREVTKAFPGAKAYVFFNNHARGQAPVNAVMLSHELGIPIKAGLTDALREAYPQIAGIAPSQPAKGQGSLF